mmetsp:Transcript_25256/g.70580  ORF Transcript_25256/g.70580 Transcript_25256/m.70580 type:complete len:297 (-) Transcript_25256:33-923(-)
MRAWRPLWPHRLPEKRLCSVGRCGTTATSIARRQLLGTRATCGPQIHSAASACPSAPGFREEHGNVALQLQNCLRLRPPVTASPLELELPQVLAVGADLGRARPRVDWGGAHEAGRAGAIVLASAPPKVADLPDLVARRRGRRRRGGRGGASGAWAAGRVAAELALGEALPVARRLAAHACPGGGAARGVLEALHGAAAGGSRVVRVAGERGRLGGGVRGAVLGHVGPARGRALQQRGGLGLVGLARAVGGAALVRQRARGQHQRESQSEASHASSGFATRCPSDSRRHAAALNRT